MTSTGTRINTNISTTISTNLKCFHGTIGVAGCGAMGLPMAQALHRQGATVWGFDVRDLRQQPDVGAFAERLESDAATFGQRIDVLISVVRDEAQTRSLLFTQQALLRARKPPRVVVLSSTLSPRLVLQLRREMDAEGLAHVALVDAPMSGAPHAAQQATLSFMVGGPAAVVNELQPLFQAMGKNIHVLGALGRGMTAKVLNNLVAASSVVATRRALAAADALGLPRDQLLAVMASSSGQNWFASQGQQISWHAEGYSPHNTMGILEKDVRAMLDGVHDVPYLAPHTLEAALIQCLQSMAPLDPEHKP
jgi:3-hydroxyisobutyrate dehydrogenase-like beta-hydroxyacid dehydrogenase